LQDERIRKMADGEIFNTITNGKNTMLALWTECHSSGSVGPLSRMFVRCSAAKTPPPRTLA
jgi:hypothetical protein